MMVFMKKTLKITALVGAVILGIGFVVMQQAKIEESNEFDLGVHKGRIAVFRPYNKDQKLMDLCQEKCMSINNQSYVHSKENQPFYFQLSEEAAPVHLTFAQTPKREPWITPLPPAKALTAGSYDNKDPNLNYSGSWIIHHNDKARGKSYHSAIERDSYLAFDFKGSAFEIGMIKNNNRHTAELCVDKICRDISLYNDTLVWQAPVLTTSLENTEHSVLLKLTDGKAIDVDWIKIWDEPTAFTSGEFLITDEAANSRFAYSEGWKTDGDIAAFKSPIGNAALGFSFVGKKIDLSFATGLDMGETTICINNQCKPHDFYSFIPNDKTISLTAPKTGMHHVRVIKGKTRYVALKSVKIE